MDTLKEFVYEAVVSFMVDGTACLQVHNATSCRTTRNPFHLRVCVA
jgi:hypothetical protein